MTPVTLTPATLNAMTATQLADLLTDVTNALLARVYSPETGRMLHPCAVTEQADKLLTTLDRHSANMGNTARKLASLLGE